MMQTGKLKKYILFIGAIIFTLASYAQQGWTSKHISIRKDGSLQYNPDSLGNIIPDFSRVGYREGRVALPMVQVIKIIQPIDSNAQALLQSAIDELSMRVPDKNGIRGAILLKKGLYKIPGTLRITASGIVLRGEGEGTKLIATGMGQRSLIVVEGSGMLKEIKGTRQRITDHYVPVGTDHLTVQSSQGLKIGDSIVVFRPGTEVWIRDLKMDQIELRDTTVKQWSPHEYDLHFERVITKINGNTIYIDNPIVMAMEDKYGGGEIYRYSFSGRINHVGVEDILCQSEYANDTDEDHGWDAIHFNKVQDSWVKNVTSIYFGYSCVNLSSQSRNITVINCKCLDAKSKIEGGRRYSFNNDGQMNLFEDCFASNGRHDFVTGARVRGPNVFYHCTAEKTHADIGPHHRWAMGTLFDNIVSDGEINAQDRGNWGTGHGWSGVNQVFWNCTSSRSAIQNPWVSGKNYVIGLQGQQYSGRLNGRPVADWEGQNRKGLQPISLYQAQLAERKKTK
jgi:hypothetical protein